jgi:hypothetical protein
MNQNRGSSFFTIDAVFLQQSALGLHNILDYFALSDFYDRSCNNAICRMRQEPLSNME